MDDLHKMVESTDLQGEVDRLQREVAKLTEENGRLKGVYQQSVKVAAACALTTVIGKLAQCPGGKPVDDKMEDELSRSLADSVTGLQRELCDYLEWQKNTNAPST